MPNEAFAPTPLGQAHTDHGEFSPAPKKKGQACEVDLPSSPPEMSSPVKTKRVNFSLAPTWMEPGSSPKTPHHYSEFKSKSILKSRPPQPDFSSLDNQSAIPLSLDAYPSFAAMLETMCNALAADDSQTKLDIYIMLNNAIRGLRNYPDSNSLERNLDLLVSYIRRDVENPTDRMDGCESRVKLQAIKLFVALAATDNLAARIDPQVVTWILNLSITSLESADVKKHTIVTYLTLLGSQRFSTRLISADPVDRIFHCVLRLHCRSRNVEAQCFLVLDMLLQVNTEYMLEHADEWVPLCLRGSFSKVCVVRSKAILLLKAAARLPKDQRLSATVQAAFEKLDEGSNVSLFDSCYGNLDELFENKEEEHILALWETVVILLSSWGKKREQRLDQWKYLNKWLDVFRRSATSADHGIRRLAILSWQKLAYAWITGPVVSYQSETSVRRMNIILSIFKFFSDNREETVSALSSTFIKITCIILTVARVPSISNPAEHVINQHDFLWKHLVEPVIQDICFRNPALHARGARMLCWLLTAPKAQERSSREICFNNLGYADIPRLNSKWVRSNSSSILRLILTTFKTSQTDEMLATAFKCWTAYLEHIEAASNREVRMSSESMACITVIFNFLLECFESLPERLSVCSKLVATTRRYWRSGELLRPALLDKSSYFTTGSPSKARPGKAPLVRMLQIMITTSSLDQRTETVQALDDTLNSVLEVRGMDPPLARALIDICNTIETEMSSHKDTPSVIFYGTAAWSLAAKRAWRALFMFHRTNMPSEASANPWNQRLVNAVLGCGIRAMSVADLVAVIEALPPVDMREFMEELCVPLISTFVKEVRSGEEGCLYGILYLAVERAMEKSDPSWDTQIASLIFSMLQRCDSPSSQGAKAFWIIASEFISSVKLARFRSSLYDYVRIFRDQYRRRPDVLAALAEQNHFKFRAHVSICERWIETLGNKKLYVGDEDLLGFYLECRVEPFSSIVFDGVYRSALEYNHKELLAILEPYCEEARKREEAARQRRPDAELMLEAITSDDDVEQTEDETSDKETGSDTLPIKDSVVEGEVASAQGSETIEAQEAASQAVGEQGDDSELGQQIQDTVEIAESDADEPVQCESELVVQSEISEEMEVVTTESVQCDDSQSAIVQAEQIEQSDAERCSESAETTEITETPISVDLQNMYDTISLEEDGVETVELENAVVTVQSEEPIMSETSETLRIEEDGVETVEAVQLESDVVTVEKSMVSEMEDTLPVEEGTRASFEVRDSELITVKAESAVLESSVAEPSSVAEIAESQPTEDEKVGMMALSANDDEHQVEDDASTDSTPSSTPPSSPLLEPGSLSSGQSASDTSSGQGASDTQVIEQDTIVSALPASSVGDKSLSETFGVAPVVPAKSTESFSVVSTPSNPATAGSSDSSSGNGRGAPVRIMRSKIEPVDSKEMENDAMVDDDTIVVATAPVKTASRAKGSKKRSRSVRRTTSKSTLSASSSDDEEEPRTPPTKRQKLSSLDASKPSSVSLSHTPAPRQRSKVVNTSSAAKRRAVSEVEDNEEEDEDDEIQVSSSPIKRYSISSTYDRNVRSLATGYQATSPLSHSGSRGADLLPLQQHLLTQSHPVPSERKRKGEELERAELCATPAPLDNSQRQCSLLRVTNTESAKQAGRWVSNTGHHPSSMDDEARKKRKQQTNLQARPVAAREVSHMSSRKSVSDFLGKAEAFERACDDDVDDELLAAMTAEQRKKLQGTLLKMMMKVHRI